MRILTDEEIALIIKEYLAEEDADLDDYNWMVGDEERKICFYQDAKTARLVYKEIGEMLDSWLRQTDKRCPTMPWWDIMEDNIAKLKNGHMPVWEKEGE